jgi:hypothetical protein
VIRRCETPGCSTLTLGRTCLACEQKQARAYPIFVTGRPYLPAPSSDEADAPGGPNPALRSNQPT